MAKKPYTKSYVVYVKLLAVLLCTVPASAGLAVLYLLYTVSHPVFIMFYGLIGVVLFILWAAVSAHIVRSTRYENESRDVSLDYVGPKAVKGELSDSGNLEALNKFLEEKDDENADSPYRKGVWTIRMDASDFRDQLALADEKMNEERDDELES